MLQDRQFDEPSEPRTVSRTVTMAAAVRTSYGPPDVVRIAEVDKPAADNNQVLVKVHATAVNRTDCGFRAGTPFFTRSFTGPSGPRLRCWEVSLPA
jgi:hypothetical protein